MTDEVIYEANRATLVRLPRYIASVWERRHLALDFDHQPGLALVPAVHAPHVRPELERLAQMVAVDVQRLVKHLVLRLEMMH